MLNLFCEFQELKNSVSWNLTFKFWEEKEKRKEKRPRGEISTKK